MLRITDEKHHAKRAALDGQEKPIKLVGDCLKLVGLRFDWTTDPGIVAVFRRASAAGADIGSDECYQFFDRDAGDLVEAMQPLVEAIEAKAAAGIGSVSGPGRAVPAVADPDLPNPLASLATVLRGRPPRMRLVIPPPIIRHAP